MSYFIKQTRNDDQDFTSSTLPDTSRPHKRLFKRQRSEASYSCDSRRSLPRTPNDSLDIDLNLNTPSYIRMPLEFISSMGQVRQPMPHSINQQSSRLSHLSKKISIANGSENERQVMVRRIESLEEELKVRSEKLRVVEEEKRNIQRELERLENKWKGMEDLKKGLEGEVKGLNEELKKAGVESKRVDQDKQALLKKVAFLQKVQFTSDTKNIQTLRENHLESQLQHVKTKLKQSKSQMEIILETQLSSMREELFSANRLIESLQISNACLQKKMDSTSVCVVQEDNYTALRSKYRKFLSEYKDLKKAFDDLQRENKQLRVKGLHMGESDFSLEVSMFSTTN